MEQSAALSISQFTARIRNLLEGDAILRDAQVNGEVSNLTYHRSGHVYFSLKDSQAQLGCVMFKGDAIRAPKLRVGDKVLARGRVSVYPPHGKYQLIVQQIQPAGQGQLYQQFLQLKARLQAEGLFDPARKQPLPRFPNRIVVLTSPTGAAVRDIMRTLRRRYGKGEVILLPTVVQGTGGAKSIVQNLAQVPGLHADVVILGRGGGSIEDLWNFNEEAVARAIAACPIPVISGVGHETDFTIADFVADKRASTPTAAAEMSVPDRATLLEQVDTYANRLRQGLRYYIDFKRQVLDDYSARLEQNLKYFIEFKRQILADYERQLQRNIRQGHQAQLHQLDLLESRLKALDVHDTLRRGFTLTLKDGQIQRKAGDLKSEDEIETVFASGRIRSKVSAEEG